MKKNKILRFCPGGISALPTICLGTVASLFLLCATAFGASLKQHVQYHYIVSPDGLADPVYLHIESDNGIDPLSRKQLDQLADTEDSHYSPYERQLSLVWDKGRKLPAALSPVSLNLCLSGRNQDIPLPEPGKLTQLSEIEGRISPQCSQIIFPAMEKPLRQPGEEAFFQSGQTGYSIWLIDAEPVLDEQQGSPSALPVLDRQGGQPSFELSGTGVSGGWDDSDFKKRRPPMGFQPPSMELEYELSWALAWLSGFARDLLENTLLSVNSDDTVIRVLDHEGNEVGLRTLSPEQLRSVLNTGNTETEVAEEDFEELIQWSRNARISIQVKNPQFWSGTQSDLAFTAPGIISVMDNGDETTSSSWSPGSASSAWSYRTAKSTASPGNSGGGYSGGGSGGGGGDGESFSIPCTFCKKLIAISKLQEHMWANHPKQTKDMWEQQHQQAEEQMSGDFSPTPSAPPPPYPGLMEGTSHIASGDVIKRRRLERKAREEAEASGKMTQVPSVPVQVNPEALFTGVRMLDIKHAYANAISVITDLPSPAQQAFLSNLSRILHPEYIPSAATYLQSVGDNYNKGGIGGVLNGLVTEIISSGKVTRSLEAKTVILVAVNLAVKDFEETNARVRKLMTEIDSIGYRVNFPIRERSLDLESVGVDLMDAGLISKSHTLQRALLQQPLKNFLRELADAEPTEDESREMHRKIDSYNHDHPYDISLDSRGTLSDVVRIFYQISAPGEEVGGKLICLLLTKSFWINLMFPEPELKDAITIALKDLWIALSDSYPKTKEAMAYLALDLLEENFLIGAEPEPELLSPLLQPQLQPVAAAAVVSDPMEATPTLRQLTKCAALAGLTIAKTKHLAFHLDVPLHTLDNLDRDMRYEEPGRRQAAIYQAWLQQTETQSWDQITKELRREGNNAAAGKIERYVKSGFSLNE